MSKRLAIVTPLAFLLLSAFTGAIAFGRVGRAFQPPQAALAAISGNVDCLDANGDGKITGDEITPAMVGDLNLDGVVDERDVQALGDLNIDLSQACSNQQRQYELQPAASGPPACVDGNASFGLIAAITGAAPEGLTNTEDGRGIRELAQQLRDKFKTHFDSAVLLAVPNLPTAMNQHAAMETWLEHVLSGILAKYPCARLVMVGHSHGASTALAVASWLERKGFGSQLAYVGLIDRVTLRYEGDRTSIPTTTVVEHLYQRNGNTDACRVGNAATADGVPVLGGPNIHEDDRTWTGLCHSTIDDDPAVHKKIIDEADARIIAPLP